MSQAQRGQAMVEFALALPVFLLTLSLVWDLSLRAWSTVCMQQAVQAACRTYALELPDEPALALDLAMDSARRACHGPRVLRLESLRAQSPTRGQALSDHNEYRDHGPSTRTLELNAKLRRIFRLPGMAKEIDLQVHASILDEDTLERRRAN